MSKLRPLSLSISLALMTAALASCQTVPSKVQLPAPLPIGAKAPADHGLTIPSQATVRAGTEVESTPSLSMRGPTSVGLGAKQELPPLSGAPITATLSNLPLAAFINEAYGNLLHVNYVLDPRLAKQTDLVTLRVTEPQTPQVFYRLVDDVLRRYGIAGVWDGSVLNIQPAKDASSSESPILVSGRALPSVPESHRPVFQLVQLHSVGNVDVAHWLRTAYNNNPQLKIDEDINRNAVVLSGPPELVGEAAKAIAVLDRPFLRGSHSRRLAPAFISADQLAPKLVEALRAEGLAASTTVAPGSAIIVLPVSAANTLLVFAPDERILDHVIQWARTLDQPNPSSSSDSIFYYPVESTKAADIAAVLNGGSGQGGMPLTMGSSVQPANEAGTAAKPATANAASEAKRSSITVDVPRNALVFRGDPAEWQRMLPLIRQMDRPTRQVMIEVTIAEVTLDDSTQIGMNWLAKNGFGGKYNGTLQLGSLSNPGTTPSSGSSGGFSYLVDVAGMNRGLLTALASHSGVKILSTPRILVNSGQEASIDVGTEVPTLSSQTASVQQTSGNSNILQSIQYRKTGIILDVKPTIYSDNRIDLDISQEDSEAQPIDSTSGVNSPAIFNRSIKTSLSLSDGGSVVLGGLVSTKETKGNSGVPLLKDIPLIGNLFKSQSSDKSRTELLLLIVPYIIESNQQAKDVTTAVIDSMQTLKQTDLHQAPAKPPATSTMPLPSPSGAPGNPAAGATH
ncbi:MAG: secretin N-terminal domain-containing protein [Rhodanobacter sp.]